MQSMDKAQIQLRRILGNENYCFENKHHEITDGLTPLKKITKVKSI